MWAGDYNLNLSQIMVEPLGLLLAASPSPRCSAPFWPLHAPLVAWHLYGIESPSPPGHPTPPGYLIPYWPPGSIHWQIRDVQCLPVCSVPNSALGAHLV